MDTFNAIRKRISVREYADRPLENEKLEKIVDAGRLAPTARAEEPWEFVVVTKKEKLWQLADITDHGKFLAEASAAIVIFCKDTKYYLEDGCAATENMLVAAADLDVSSCWIAGDKKLYCSDIARALGAPQYFKLISIISLGYPKTPPLPHKKRPLKEVLHWEKFLVFAAIFLTSATALAADFSASSKMLVLPFIFDKEKLKDTADEFTNVAIEEVKTSGYTSYVSREEFLKNWFGEGEESNLFGKDLKEDFDLRSLLPMFNEEDIGTISEYNDLWKIDFVVACGIIEKGGLFNITMRVLSMDTGRFNLDIFNCEPAEAKRAIRKHLYLLLKKAEGLRKVMADGIANPIMSIVTFDIKSVEGEDIRITADYASKRPNPKLQNVSIDPLKPLDNGKKRLKIKSEEERIIEIDCSYRNGSMENVLVDTVPLSLKGEAEEVFFVRSKGGYLIKFVFRFKDGIILLVKVEPKVNPYP